MSQNIKLALWAGLTGVQNSRPFDFLNAPLSLLQQKAVFIWFVSGMLFTLIVVHC